MKKLETKLGTLFYEETPDYDEDTYLICDSDGEFFARIYGTNTFNKVKETDDIMEFLTRCVDCAFFGTTMEELLEEINDCIIEDNKKYGLNDNLMCIEDLYGNEYLNHIGEYYVFIVKD